jgi:hypothetical protein
MGVLESLVDRMRAIEQGASTRDRGWEEAVENLRDSSLEGVRGPGGGARGVGFESASESASGGDSGSDSGVTSGVISGGDFETTLENTKINTSVAKARHDSGGSKGYLKTGWQGVDAAVGGLKLGGVHEWFGSGEGGLWGCDPRFSSVFSGFQGWSPPLCLLAHLACRAMCRSVTDGGGGGDRRALGGDDALDRGLISGINGDISKPFSGSLIGSVYSSFSRAGSVVWVGRRCWPHVRLWERLNGVFSGLPEAIPGFLPGKSPGAGRSFFVDVVSDADRLWAMDLALRCRSVAVVVGDGSGLDMASSRRLQLAAQFGGGLGLIVRPRSELSELSAASTRWLVEPLAGVTGRPRWSLTLLRRKGLGPIRGLNREPIREPIRCLNRGLIQPAVVPDSACDGASEGLSEGVFEPAGEGVGGGSGGSDRSDQPRWTLELDDETGVVGVPAELADRPFAASRGLG